jgi:4-hydroxy-3-polyprenylbenzoate decarboxylase
MVPVTLPGVEALHAVDAAGVHPLLLAIGSERYVPYGEREPREILTCANAILGFGQASLAKYLFIVAKEDDPHLDVNDVEAFFHHLLSRVDFRRDLHFQTRTTIDTLDYSGTGLNAGSKLVVAAAGRARRELSRTAPPTLGRLAIPGVLVMEAPRFPGYERVEDEMEDIAAKLSGSDLAGLPLVVLADDPDFAAKTQRNFLWVTFTRSNPSHDVHGVGSFLSHKHWGCEGPLIIDARLKPHHAPPLVEDPNVSARVDALCSKGRSLHGVL